MIPTSQATTHSEAVRAYESASEQLVTALLHGESHGMALVRWRQARGRLLDVLREIDGDDCG